MNAIHILQRYIAPDTELYHLVYTHSRNVADKALSLAVRHPELHLDLVFLEEASLIHDIGVFKTNAPDIKCFGESPYICHGYLGREIVEKEGFLKHALVCERHTGTGLSLQEILDQALPLPHRDLCPVSLEEQLICFADKFFSKTRLNEEMKLLQVRSKLEKYGMPGVKRFDAWCELFG
ncbi:MAG: HD domain-containing protein [Bacteroidales bacterium]|nr:HD domain-containing protein [Bacteroidales bacterium]